MFRVGLVLLKQMLGSVDKLREMQGMYETMERLRNIPPETIREEVLVQEVRTQSHFYKRKRNREVPLEFARSVLILSALFSGGLSVCDGGLYREGVRYSGAQVAGISWRVDSPTESAFAWHTGHLRAETQGCCDQLWWQHVIPGQSHPSPWTLTCVIKPPVTSWP